MWRSGPYKAVLYDDYRLQIDGNQNKVVLYNIREDIGERHDLAESHPDVVERLMGVLKRAEASFVDPRWRPPFYVPQNIDIYPNGAPEGAPVMYFGG